ncbi:hypothetical protein Q5M85_20780 [Paraclostridium bifermentans]|nr:hypothetical protein [Paraclostridium bifermentans]
MITDVYKLIGDKYELQANMLGAKKLDTLRYVTIPLDTSRCNRSIQHVFYNIF